MVPVRDQRRHAGAGATLVYDEARRKMVYFGSDPGCLPPSSGPDTCVDAWELIPPSPPTTTTYSWVALPAFASPTDDGRPVPRTGHGMVYDPGRSESLLFAGAATFDTWRYHGGATDTAAQILHVDFNAAQAGPTAVVRDVVLQWAAGATAFPNGAASNGVGFFAIERGARRFIAFNSASAAAPATTTSGAQTNTSALFSGKNELVFGAEPQQLNGNGAAFAKLVSDYAEVRVRYRLP